MAQAQLDVARRRKENWASMCDLALAHVGFTVTPDSHIQWEGGVRFGKGNLLHLTRFLAGRRFRDYQTACHITAQVDDLDNRVLSIIQSSEHKLTAAGDMLALERAAVVFKELQILCDKRFTGFAALFRVLGHLITPHTLACLRTIAKEGNMIRHPFLSPRSSVASDSARSDADILGAPCGIQESRAGSDSDTSCASEVRNSFLQTTSSAGSSRDPESEEQCEDHCEIDYLPNSCFSKDETKTFIKMHVYIARLASGDNDSKCSDTDTPLLTEWAEPYAWADIETLTPRPQQRMVA